MADIKLENKGVIELAYNKINGVVSEIGAKIDSSVYSSFRDVFYNSITYNLIGIMLVIWCIKNMKGGIGKEELFKGGIWLITLLFVYGVLYNFNTYQEFKQWFLIPALLAKTAFSTLGNGDNAGAILGVLIEKPFELYADAFNVGLKELDGWGPEFDILMDYLIVFIVLFPWLIYSILVTIVCLGIIIIQVLSTLASFIFGSFAPLMIMLLIIPQLRGNFFSWLKNYIAITLFLPMSMLALLAMQKSNEVAGINNPEMIFFNFLYSFFMAIMGLILGIYILKKAPEWINMCIGSTESGSGFGAGAAQATIGAATGGTMLMGSSIANIASGGRFSNALKNMKENGGLSSAIGRKLFGKKEKENKKDNSETKNGMTATSQHYDKK